MQTTSYNAYEVFSNSLYLLKNCIYLKRTFRTVSTCCWREN